MASYVIGIGSQRCGTTLLHALLGSAPGLAMHPVKELHYFDVRSGLRPLSLQRSRARSRLFRQLARPHRLFNGSGMLAAKTNWLQARAANADYPYSRLFGGMFGANRAVGEVTPEYMLLSANGVRQMRETLGETHIILLTRDPLQRVLSSLKLRLDAMGSNSGLLSLNDADRQVTVFLDQNPGWVKRQRDFNNYQAALERFQQEFRHVLALDYKQLIEELEGKALLEQFLNVTFDEAKYRHALSQRHNAHHQPLQLSSSVIDRISRLFELG